MACYCWKRCLKMKWSLRSFVLVEQIKRPKKPKTIIDEGAQMFRNLRQELLTRIYNLFPIPFFQQILYANEPGIIAHHHLLA